MEQTDETRFSSLMQRYQAGDEEAFAELYSLTAPAIRRYLGRWVDSSRAGDLLQETYLQMHRARRTFRPELPFRPWLYAIARHVAQGALRTHARRTSKEVQQDQNFDIPAESDEARLIARDQLDTVLAELSPEQREVVLLAEIEGMSSLEISRITGATEGAVRVRLHRANQKLKALLTRETQ